MKRDPRQKKPALGGSSSEWLVACTRGPGARNASTSIPQTCLNQIGIIFVQIVDRDDCTNVSYLNLVELPFPLLGGTHIMDAPRLKVSRLKVQDQAFNQNNTTLQLVSWHFFFLHSSSTGSCSPTWQPGTIINSSKSHFFTLQHGHFLDPSWKSGAAVWYVHARGPLSAIVYTI